MTLEQALQALKQGIEPRNWNKLSARDIAMCVVALEEVTKAVGKTPEPQKLEPLPSEPDEDADTSNSNS